MIHLDTSLLIDALAQGRPSLAQVRQEIESGERLGLSALALYEWRRGPRTPEEIQAQEALFPAAGAVAFGPDEAMQAAALYRVLAAPEPEPWTWPSRPAPSSTTPRSGTLNPEDFEDVPGLMLHRPR